jgi:ketosteroid isomerase-like protein
MTTREVVTAYLSALRDGDVDALRAAFTPDATWHFPGDLPVSGTWTGPAEIIDVFLARMMERLDTTAPVSVRVRNLVVEGDQAVAEWTTRARSVDGQPYENDYGVFFRVTDGRISAVREYLDTAYTARTLFSA